MSATPERGSNSIAGESAPRTPPPAEQEDSVQDSGLFEQDGSAVRASVASMASATRGSVASQMTLKGLDVLTSVALQQRNSSISSSASSELAGISNVDLERLSTLSRETSNKLHVLWDEMGLSEEERHRQLGSLVECVEQVFVQKLVDEVALRDEYVNAAKNLESDISGLAAMLGEVRKPAEHDTSGSNLMLNLTWLRSELVHFSALKAERMEKLTAVRDKLVAIWTELGSTPVQNLLETEGFLSPEGMREYDAALAGLQRERTRRIAAVQEHINDINGLFEELVVSVDCDDKEEQGESTQQADAIGDDQEAQVELEFDRAIAAGGEALGIDEDMLERLSHRARELTNEKIKRTEQLKLLGAQIQPLWEKLGVDQEARQRFFMENRGLGLAVIEQCKAELERLNALKQERMGDLINDAQQKVTALWDEMQYSDEQREAFTQQAMMGPVNEATLEAHEQEILILEQQAELYRPVLKFVETYAKLCADRESLQERKSDPKRLLNRQNGAQLREELKMEQRVKVGIPKTMDRIKNAVEEYEEQHGPFLLGGERYLDTMKSNEQAFLDKLNESKNKRKKNAENQGAAANRPRRGAAGAGSYK